MRSRGRTRPDQPGWAGVGLSVPSSRTVLLGTAEPELGVQGKARENFPLGFWVELRAVSDGSEFTDWEAD